MKSGPVKYLADRTSDGGSPGEGEACEVLMHGDGGKSEQRGCEWEVEVT